MDRRNHMHVLRVVVAIAVVATTDQENCQSDPTGQYIQAQAFHCRVSFHWSLGGGSAYFPATGLSITWSIV